MTLKPKDRKEILELASTGYCITDIQKITKHGYMTIRKTLESFVSAETAKAVQAEKSLAVVPPVDPSQVSSVPAKENDHPVDFRYAVHQLVDAVFSSRGGYRS